MTYRDPSPHTNPSDPPSPVVREANPWFVAALAGSAEDIFDLNYRRVPFDDLPGVLLCAIHGLNPAESLVALICVGVDVLSPIEDGRTTLLHEAFFCGKEDAAALLIEAGAKASARDSDGRTALEVLSRSRACSRFCGSVSCPKLRARLGETDLVGVWKDAKAEGRTWCAEVVLKSIADLRAERLVKNKLKNGGPFQCAI